MYLYLYSCSELSCKKTQAKSSMAQSKEDLGSLSVPLLWKSKILNSYSCSSWLAKIIHNWHCQPSRKDVSTRGYENTQGWFWHLVPGADENPSQKTTGLMQVDEEALSQWKNISFTPLFEGQNDILTTVYWGLDPPLSSSVKSPFLEKVIKDAVVKQLQVHLDIFRLLPIFK